MEVETINKILNYSHPIVSNHALRMKLDALHYGSEQLAKEAQVARSLYACLARSSMNNLNVWVCLVMASHYCAILCPCGYNNVL